MKPTIGRIVRYVDSPGVVWPAIIVRVHSDELVSLQVFKLGSVEAETSVSYAPASLEAGRTWHWPERA